MKFTKYLVLVSLSGCGQLEKCQDQNKSDSECKVESPNFNSVKSISGSISGAFEVVVDGQAYRDIEDYYTQEIDALDSRVAKLGYEGYESKLDARLGYADLTSGMVAYLAPVARGGYSDKVYVGSNGQFNFILPGNAEDAFYRLKAVKRINLTLKNEKETLKFCFNFSTVEKNADLIQGKAEALSLNEFQTSLTKYDCQQADKDTGISPPARSVDKI